MTEAAGARTRPSPWELARSGNGMIGALATAFRSHAIVKSLTEAGGPA